MNSTLIILPEKFPQLRDIGIMDFRYEHRLGYTTASIKHHHGCSYEIGYIQRGYQAQLTFSQDPDTKPTLHELHAEDIILFSPYSLHSTEKNCMISADAYWIVLDTECPNFLQYPPEKAVLLHRALDKIRQPVLHPPRSTAQRLTEAFTLLTNPTETNVFCACNLLSLFILELSDFEVRFGKSSEEFGSASRTAIEAAFYINSNLLSPELNLDSIAKHLNYSRTYTSTLLKQEFGMNLQDYITYNKIKYACTLLEDYTVTEVAVMLNYSSSQYFSNVFKKQMNMTPSQYRLNLQKHSERAVTAQ